MSKGDSKKQSRSGIVLKLTPDYGFHENKDFIRHLKDDYEKFEGHLTEYKEVLAGEPEAIDELEKMVKTHVQNFVKDGSFVEMNTFWKNLREKRDLVDARGFKSKNHEKINEDVSLECKRYHLGLYTTYCCYIGGSLTYVNQSVALKTIPDLPLLNTFTKSKARIPWCIINKLLKQHLRDNHPPDSDSVAIHINRKKA